MRFRLVAIGVVGGVLAGLSPPAQAAPSENSIQWAAHFSQLYQWTEGFSNSPLDLSPSGTMRPLTYALRSEFRLSERATLVGELSGSGEPVLGEDSAASQRYTSQLEPRISVAAGLYRVWDALQVGVGLQRLPLGLYNEYRHVGLAYENATLPLLYQPLLGFIAESYRGIFASYQKATAAGHLSLDAWYGDFDIQQVFLHAQPRHVRKAGGGKLVWTDLLDGLDLGASAFHGEDDNWRNELGLAAIIGVRAEKTVSTWTAFARYQAHGLGLRAEYAESNPSLVSMSGLISCEVTDWLRPFLAYDRLNLDRDNPERLYHHAWSYGINLIPEAGWMIKLEVQEMPRNLFNSSNYIGQERGQVDHLYTGGAAYSWF